MSIPCSPLLFSLSLSLPLASPFSRFLITLRFLPLQYSASSLSLFNTLPLPLRYGGKHSQSFSPFCDSISADIAAVSLDSSIRSDEDAAEGDIFACDRETDRDGENRRN